MKKLLSSVFLMSTLSACTATEFNSSNGPITHQSSATLEVTTQSFSDYFKENIRIKGIKKADGDIVLEHPWYLPHTVKAVVNAPSSYEVTLLCEKPLKLQFKNPTANLDVSPNCHYQLKCDWSDDGAKVIATSQCNDA